MDGFIHNLYVTDTKKKKQQKYTFENGIVRDDVESIIANIIKVFGLTDLKVTSADYVSGGGTDDE